MNTLSIRIVQDLDEAKKLWELLSPRTSFYDLWDVRYSFYRQYTYPLHFIVGYEDDQPAALLPLQKNTERNHLEFFGGDYMESNTIFTQSANPQVIEELLATINQPAELDFIDRIASTVAGLALQDHKYTLDVSAFQTSEDFLNTAFSGKRRKNLTREARIVEATPVEVHYGRKEDIAHMFELNIRNFGEDSFFFASQGRQAFLDLAALPLDPAVVSITSGGVIHAVSFACVYKDVYYYLNAGSNTEQIANLGKYLIYKNIDHAIKRGARVFDAGVEDLGWKSALHFQELPQYMYYK